MLLHHILTPEQALLYKQVSAPCLDSLTETITYTYFNLKDFEKPLQDDVKLGSLYKLLSRAYLLKEPLPTII